MFKYNWIWEKTRPTGFLNAKKRPLKVFEDICIFGNESIVFYPQNLIKINKKMKNMTI